MPHCKNFDISLLVLDSFGAHKTDEVNEHGIHCLIIPPRTTSYLQPLDVSINGPFKEALRCEWEEYIESDKLELTELGNIKRASYS